MGDKIESVDAEDQLWEAWRKLGMPFNDPQVRWRMNSATWRHFRATKNKYGTYIVPSLAKLPSDTPDGWCIFGVPIELDEALGKNVVELTDGENRADFALERNPVPLLLDSQWGHSARLFEYIFP